MKTNSMSDAIDFCLQHKIDIEQFLFLYFLRAAKISKGSRMKEYLKMCGNFDADNVVIPLEEAGLIENMNSPGKYYPEMFMITPACDEIFISSDAFDDLWNEYPPTFPLKDGSLFISRAGMDKDDLADIYMSRIDYNVKTHRHVMNKLASYKRLVSAGKLNGHKIVQFVREALWESIPDSKEEGESWGVDV